jgi:hypothetical protein
MNIISLQNNPGQQDYLLKEDDRTVLKLRYNNDRHIARVETGKEKRVLIIEEQGLLRTLLVLKNEYGVRIGSLHYDNFSATHGTVDIENTKYRFDLKQNGSPELHVYERSRRNLIYSCQLIIENNNSKAVVASLVIAITWYLFLKGETQKEHALNKAIVL